MKFPILYVVGLDADFNHFRNRGGSSCGVEKGLCVYYVTQYFHAHLNLKQTAAFDRRNSSFRMILTVVLLITLSLGLRCSSEAGKFELSWNSMLN